MPSRKKLSEKLDQQQATKLAATEIAYVPHIACRVEEGSFQGRPIHRRKIRDTFLTSVTHKPSHAYNVPLLLKLFLHAGDTCGTVCELVSFSFFIIV
ncbi:hypothetical protein BaRGS_00000643 [Batillaria attramentaria]|uniref:Uncharacterized protein n=1 Tax=Batillaria attramentaria TaxID=370345 RepID=A0ABD0MAE2_9CAEN